MGLMRTEAAGDQIVNGAFGIIVVSSDAFAAGTASLPGPLSDAGNDWFVWVPFHFMTGAGASAGDEALVFRTSFDSRGMRKLKIGDVTAPVIEVEADLAGGTIDIGYSYREQIKT